MPDEPTQATSAPSDGRCTKEDATIGWLLQTLAESLDVRETFARISETARQAIPHDLLILSEHHPVVRIVALSEEIEELSVAYTIPDAVQALNEREYVFDADLVDEGSQTFAGWFRFGDGAPDWHAIFDDFPMASELVHTRGLRTFLRVPVRLRGVTVGALLFCSRVPGTYSTDYYRRCRILANCVALALSHQSLSIAEQRNVEMRARAEALETRIQRLSEELEARDYPRVLGQSKSWREVLAAVVKVAPTEATVLLSGESGTGKEVIARSIYLASPRRRGPFVALNCAALPEPLLESELFGHEKGSFTGAAATRIGKIEQASGGVLFLDEIAEMNPPTQAKLLRVLQEREYQRLGGVRTLKADVRILAATNRDLAAAIMDKTFREDLYYRLAVFEIVLPPLRDRRDDILPMAKAFLHDMGRSAVGISCDAQAQLAAYHWPGNVRELRNTIERAVIWCEGREITGDHLHLGRAQVSEAGAGKAVAPTLAVAERALILDAMARAGNNKSHAARLLGITRAQLRARLDRYDLHANLTDLDRQP